MIALDISVNGERHCVAGVGDDGIVTAFINWMGGHGRDRLEARVGGLVRKTGQKLHWPSAILQVGDEVTVRFVEVDQPDQPTD